MTTKKIDLVEISAFLAAASILLYVSVATWTFLADSRERPREAIVPLRDAAVACGEMIAGRRGYISTEATAHYGPRPGSARVYLQDGARAVEVDVELERRGELVLCAWREP